MKHGKPRTSKFEKELVSHVTALSSLARHLTGDDCRADDLLQDTVVLALRFQTRYHQGTNLKSWLFRIMKNCYISGIRRRRLEEKSLDREGAHSLRAWTIGEMSRRSTTGGGNVDRDDGFCDVVQQAIGMLKSDYLEVIALCDLQDCTYQEAARKIGRPVGTVMSRLHRGRQKLKDHLVSRAYVEAAA